jgi:hypothetical protein
MQPNTLTRQEYKGKRILENIMLDPKQYPDLKPAGKYYPDPTRFGSTTLNRIEEIRME